MGSLQWGGNRVDSWFAAIAAVVLLSSCTAPAPVPADTRSPATADISPVFSGSRMPFDCVNPIQSATVIGDLTGGPGALDVMALFTDGGVREWADGAKYQGLVFQKIPIALKTGAQMTLSVPEEMRGQMKIGWSNAGYTVANELAVQGCTTPNVGTSWVVYPGGFWLKEPGCVPLTVTTEAATKTIDLPIGKSCP